MAISRSLFLSGVLIGVILVSSVSIFVAVAEDQTTSLPVRTLGDKWTFSISIGLTGTMTQEITSTSVSVSGYDCTEFTVTGGGNTQGFTGSWTMKGEQYEAKTDFSETKSENTIQSITSAFNETITTQTDYNPPLNNYNFPLFVGKSWTSITNQTHFTKHDLNGVSTQGNDSKKTSSNFIVLRTEYTIVPAGEFQTFVINVSRDDGTSSQIYYSSKANMQVKELDYLPNGNLGFSLELLNFTVAASVATPTPTATPTSQPTTASTQVPTNKPTTNPTKQPDSSPTSTPSQTIDPTSSPSPIVTAPEYPSWTIPLLLCTILATYGLLIYQKKHKHNSDKK